MRQILVLVAFVCATTVAWAGQPVKKSVDQQKWEIKEQQEKQKSLIDVTAHPWVTVYIIPPNFPDPEPIED